MLSATAPAFMQSQLRETGSGKLELPTRNSQAGAWELAPTKIVTSLSRFHALRGNEKNFVLSALLSYMDVMNAGNAGAFFCPASPKAPTVGALPPA